MLERLIIKNFQSLKDVDIELGKFSVIVGESSHGKSAILRAINAIASNELDADNITQGQKYATITAKTENGTVTIERKQGGSSAYQVAQIGSQESSFTKLNRQVPSEVTQILGILPNTKEVTSINFAGQHDSPYLLKDSASNVARVLGDLTKVSTIFEAVKEASRRSKAANTLVNLRKKDLDKILANISDYAKVTVEAKGITALELELSTAQELEAQSSKLASLVTNLEASQKVLESYEDLPDIPELASVLELYTRVNTFINLIKQVAESSKQVKYFDASIDRAESDILLAEGKLHDCLVDAGSCPLCHQTIQ